jgi:ketosteroid isomerase-like protein
VTDFSRLNIFTAGDLGYAVGPTRLVFTSSGGDKVSLETRMTLVFKRIDGKWTCVHEHLSVPTTLK